MNPAREQRAILTVGQINAYVKQLLESDRILANIWVRGEISNFTNHYKTGHLYFTLKDAESAVSVVMFKSSAAKLKFLPESGMTVIVHGRVSAFPRTGQYQIYADVIEPDGVGGLFIAFEQLKRKLAAEGLFDAERKRPLPKYPSRVGVITSPTGAAVRDIINISGRRFPLSELIIFPALVQGEGASVSLAAGMKYFNTPDNDGKDRVDLIIIGRGGGSAEDLWAFNDETLARLVASSRIPVISAVGHEIDFTICDFAADLRAPTPSAAAELAFPDRRELERWLMGTYSRISSTTLMRIVNRRAALKKLAESRALTAPQNTIDDKRMQLASLSGSLDDRVGKILTGKRAKLAELTASIDALNPMRVISRGYAAVWDADGRLVKTVSDASAGESLTLRLSDGEIDAEITSVRPFGTNEGK